MAVIGSTWAPDTWISVGGWAENTWGEAQPPAVDVEIICFETELEPLIALTVSLGECEGVAVSALLVGNDMPVKIIGANIDGTYVNGGDAEYSIYGDDDETVIFGPEPMTYVASSNGDYAGVLDAADLQTLIDDGDMTIGNSYRIRRTLVDGSNDAQTDTYYPLLYRSGVC